MKKIPHPHEVRDTLRDAYTQAGDKHGTVLLENAELGFGQYLIEKEKQK
jgi:hypothetical protein